MKDFPESLYENLTPVETEIKRACMCICVAVANTPDRAGKIRMTYPAWEELMPAMLHVYYEALSKV